jgi:hypothetical protein
MLRGKPKEFSCPFIIVTGSQVVASHEVTSQRCFHLIALLVLLGTDSDDVGTAYALMNDSAKAIEWLRVSAEDGFPCYPLFETDPNFHNLRQDPRFTAMLSKLKQQ